MMPLTRFLVGFVDGTLRVGATVFYLIFLTMILDGLTRRPDLLQEFAETVARSPIMNPTLAWAFLITCLAWSLNKLWRSVRFIIIRIITMLGL
jgi:hypothetical protein